MKTFSASDLGSHKRTEIFNAAREEGVIIQKKNTNGDVLEEFYLVKAERYGGCVSAEEMCINIEELN